MMHKTLLLLFIFLASCSGDSFLAQRSSIEVHSMGLDRVTLYADYTTIVCTNGFANEGDIWMTDIPMDQIVDGTFTTGQIVHLQVLWTPVAGKTPLASTSTNLAIEHYIIANGEVGVYGGGGYCWSRGNPAQGMRLHIEEATIAIQEQSDGFSDLLTPATMTGHISAEPNNTVAQRIASAVQRIDF